MPLSPHTPLGPYEIVTPLGAGGMGEVYRARDTRLGRDVAIKVLKPDLSSDGGRLRRFEHEARTASALNHPNIVTLYDVGREGTIAYLAMELVEGQSLRERMLSGPLPWKTALSVAGQMAEGIAAAHATGIVHRDLKPENVMVTREGYVKILDFGLAKLALSAGQSLSDAPTLAESGHTRTGVVMGTIGYMSPEQAAGSRVDHRSDQFSFGSVLYEMIAGQRAFRGDSAAETLTAILRDEPVALGSLRPNVPAPLLWIVKRCLSKDPAARYDSTRDLARDLSEVQEHISEVDKLAEPTLAASKRKTWVRIVESGACAIAAAVLTAVVFASHAFDRRPVANPVQRFATSLNAPEGTSFELGSAAISSDGAHLVFGTTDGRLWVRDLSQPQSRELPGGASGKYPFWSPDGRTVAFFSDQKLKAVDLSGASTRVICDAPDGRGGAWNRQGVIVFAPDYRGPLFRVPAAGGDPAPVTDLVSAREDASHRWPSFLPDDQHFLYLATPSSAGPQDLPWIVVGSLDSKESRTLGRAASRPSFSSPGFLLYVRGDRTLVAQPFDEKQVITIGSTVPIADQVAVLSQRWNPGFAVSQNGVLVYQFGIFALSKLAWLDVRGREVESVGPRADLGEFQLAPDGRRAAVEVVDPRTGSVDLWIYDLERGGGTRWTNDPADDRSPIWSPDGRSIIFVSFRNGRPNLYMGPSDRAAAERLLLDSPHHKRPTDWSSDGQWLLYDDYDPKSKWDVWALPLFGDRKPRPFLSSDSEEEHARFSPDGRWVAYQSNQSGQSEIYVTSFPDPGARTQVSMAGGRVPKWSADGKEIYFVAGNRRLMSAAIATGSPPSVGVPKLLFESADELSKYNPSPDSKRFLVVLPQKDFRPPPLTVVVNWTAGLQR